MEAAAWCERLTSVLAFPIGCFFREDGVFHRDAPVVQRVVCCGDVGFERLLAGAGCIDQRLQFRLLFRRQLAQLVQQSGELGVELF